MPFDIIGILRNEFNKVDREIKKDMAKNPGSVTEKQYAEFNRIVNSVNVASIAINEMSEGDKPLTREDAAVAASMLSIFAMEAETYAEESPLYQVLAGHILCADIKEYLIAVKAQASYLEQASKQPKTEPMPTMKDILSNYSWVESVFTEDPDIAANKKKFDAKAAWDYKAHTIAENTAKYKEAVTGLPEKFLQHVRNITGNTEDPMTSFTGKVLLLQTALNQFPGSDKNTIKIRQVIDVYNSALKKFDTDNLETMGSSELVTSSLIDKNFALDFDTTRIEGDLETVNMNETDRAYFTKAISKLRIKPYNMGIDAEKLNALDESVTIFQMINMADDLLIKYNDDINAYETGDTGNPIYGTLKISEKIRDKAIGFLQGVDGAEPVNDDDIRSYLLELANSSMKSAPFKNDGSINRNYDSGFQSIEAIVEQFPQFKDLDDLCKFRDETRRQKKSEDIYKSLGSLNPDSDEYAAEIDKFKKLNRAQFLDEKLADKIEFLDMCKDADRRENMIRSGNPRQRVIASIIEHEFNCAKKFSEGERGIRNKITNTYNHAITETFFSDNPLDAEKLADLDAYYASVMNSPVVQVLVAKDHKYLDMVVPNGGCGAILYAKNHNVLASLDAGTIDALTQASGNLNSSNSDEYTAVGEKMKLYAAEVQRPGGASKETCKALYEACTTYMYTHDSMPSTPNGKLRFNAAATVMAKLLPEMLEKNPDMWNQIESDVKINMIRSKLFRSEVAGNSRLPFRDMAENVTNVLKSGPKKDMITGKTATKKLRDDLLNKFTELEKDYQAKTQKSRKAVANTERTVKSDKNKVIGPQ